MSIKKILYLSVFGILALFLLQNIESTRLIFLLWEFTLPRAVILSLTFGLGFLTHYILFAISVKAKEVNEDQARSTTECL